MNEPVNVTPMDHHNETLVGNVHPANWINPTPKGRYNLVVIGGGTAGLVTAAGAAGLGAKVALIERNLLGGDCLNVGCVPSKCLIRSSRVVAELRRAKNYGINVPDGIEVDFGAVMERMRQIRARISHNDSAQRFRDLGVDVFLGDAVFSGSDTVDVAGRTLQFKKAVLTMGARAYEPPVDGLADTGFLTNETVFSLTEQPRRLAVIGGGPLGCELAQTFSRLGCEVTIFDKASHLLTREDADAAKVLQNTFVREGIKLILDCKFTKVTEDGAEKILHFECCDKTEQVRVDEILIGAGRVPNVDGLNLERVGVQYDTRHGVKVNDKLQTTNPSIYAAGDVCFPHKFTHAADFTARIVIQNALFWGRKKSSALTIPWCTYTDPEIAHVGMYEHDAQARGIKVDTYTRPLSEVDRAIADGEDDGFVRIHVKKGTDKILGATIVASHAGDMISEVSVAMAGGLGLSAIANVIHPYPTQAEAIRQLGDEYNRTKLTPFVKGLFTRILKWRR